MITTIMIAAAAGVPCAIAGFALGRLTGLAGLRNELSALDAENTGLAGKLASTKRNLETAQAGYFKLAAAETKRRKPLADANAERHAEAVARKAAREAAANTIQVAEVAA